MRTTHFSISIPEPCSENWEEMTPCEKGRFCGSCQKTVIDFTTWTDAELIDFWSRKENWGTCGRFYNHHVEEKTLFSFTTPLKKPYRTLAMAASVAALTIMSAAAASAQGYSTAGPPPFPITRQEKSTETRAHAKDSAEKITTLTKEDVEKMPVRDLTNQARTTMGGGLKSSRGDSLNISGGRAENTLIIIDSFNHLLPLPAATCFMEILPQKRNLFQRIWDWFRKVF